MSSRYRFYWQGVLLKQNNKKFERAKYLLKPIPAFYIRVNIINVCVECSIPFQRIHAPAAHVSAMRRAFPSGRSGTIIRTTEGPALHVNLSTYIYSNVFVLALDLVEICAMVGVLDRMH